MFTSVVPSFSSACFVWCVFAVIVLSCFTSASHPYWTSSLVLFVFVVFVVCCCLVPEEPLRRLGSSRDRLPYKVTVHPTQEHPRCPPTFPLFVVLEGWSF